MAFRKFNKAERVEVLSKEEGAKIAAKLGRTLCTCPAVCTLHQAKTSPQA